MYVDTYMCHTSPQQRLRLDNRPLCQDVTALSPPYEASTVA